MHCIFAIFAATAGFLHLHVHSVASQAAANVAAANVHRVEAHVVTNVSQGFQYTTYVVSDPVAFKQLRLSPGWMVVWNGMVILPGYQYTSSSVGIQVLVDVSVGDYVTVISAVAPAVATNKGEKP